MITTMFNTNSYIQLDPFRRLYESYLVNSLFWPPAMLIVFALFIGLMSMLAGISGENLALVFISDAALPITMAQISFLAVAYATGPLYLMLGPGRLSILIRQLSTDVMSCVSELVSLLSSMRDAPHLSLASSDLPALRSVQFALAATPTTNHIPGESPKLE